MIRLVGRIDMGAAERLRTLAHSVGSPVMGSSTPVDLAAASVETAPVSNQNDLRENVDHRAAERGVDGDGVQTVRSEGESPPIVRSGVPGNVRRSFTNLDDSEPTVVDEEPSHVHTGIDVDGRHFNEEARARERSQRLVAREYVFRAYGAAAGMWSLAGITWWIDHSLFELPNAWWFYVILGVPAIFVVVVGIWFGGYLEENTMFSSRIFVAPDDGPGTAQNWKWRHLRWALGVGAAAIIAIILVTIT